MSFRVLCSLLFLLSISTYPRMARANAAEEATVAGDPIVVYEDMSSQSEAVKTLPRGQSG